MYLPCEAQRPPYAEYQFANNSVHVKGNTMTEATLIAHCGTRKITRDELATIPPPEGTATHRPVAHIEVVREIEQSLAFRQIEVKSEEFAVSPDGMRLFGVMRLAHGFDGCDFAVGLRNSNDKSMRLGLVAGYRVLVCDNMAFAGEFRPVMAKHTKGLSLADLVTLGVDKIQRNFVNVERQVTGWKSITLTDMQAKAIIYDAFTGSFRLPKNLIPAVHNHYFDPREEEFMPRTMWSLSNAFTSALKLLRPVRQFQATAKLTPFLEACLN
jgi:Domain of unknown function (DUF932)